MLHTTINPHAWHGVRPSAQQWKTNIYLPLDRLLFFLLKSRQFFFLNKNILKVYPIKSYIKILEL